MGNTEAPHAPAILTTDDKTRHEITAGLRANEELIYEFTKAWYRSPYTFRSTKFLGYPACKIPLDLWVFHDLFVQYRFQTVIETGTAGGGATLWMAVLMDLLGIDHGRIYSIDVDAEEDHGVRPKHPRITYITGSSTDPEVVDMLRQVIVAPLLVDLDSDHHAPHVLRELEAYAPLVPVGSWLITEDTNGAPVETDKITGEPIMVEGPWAAICQYLDGHPGEWILDPVCQRFWLSMMNPGGWMQRLRPCEHA